MMLRTKIILILICYLVIEICIAIVFFPPYDIPITKVEEAEVINYTTGIASWYDYDLKGVEWSLNHRTAASRTLTRYETYTVTNLANGKSVEVFINDYVENPKVEIDLSSFAFSQIADLSLGIINVKINK